MARFSQLWAKTVRPRPRRTPHSGRGSIGLLVNRSQIAIAPSDTAIPAVQDCAMPTPNPSCRAIAAAGNSSSLAAVNATLRDSCNPPRIKPMVAWSNTRVTPVSATPTANSAARSGVPVMCPKRPLTLGATTANTSPRTTDPMPEASNAAETRPTRVPCRRGSSPMSRVPRPNMPIVPSTVIADTAAEPYPTASWLNMRAATAQYANPMAEVTPVVATRLLALRSRS